MKNALCRHDRRGRQQFSRIWVLTKSVREKLRNDSYVLSHASGTNVAFQVSCQRQFIIFPRKSLSTLSSYPLSDQKWYHPP